MKYFSVAVGGFLGAISRFLIQNIHFSLKSNFPINTFIINIVGSFILCLVLTVGLEKFLKNENVKPLVTAGFISSFTTFSTFTLESIKLIEKGSLLTASQYILLSLTFGLLAAHFGSFIGTSISKHRADSKVTVEVLK